MKILKKRLNDNENLELIFDLCVQRVLMNYRSNSKIMNRKWNKTVLADALDLINIVGCNMPQKSLLNILELDLRLMLHCRILLEDKLFFSRESIFSQSGGKAHYIIDVADVLEVCVKKSGINLHYKGMVLDEDVDGKFTMCSRGGTKSFYMDECVNIISFTKDI